MTRPFVRDAWLVAGLGFVVRMAVVLWAWTRIPPVADGDFYHRVAQRIADGHGYTWLWPDGAVTYAAHYPVGYPAMMAVPYALVAAHPGWVMVMNALVGALACWAAHQLVLLHQPQHRRAALTAGVLVACHPGLVSYTPALMTEGVTAALWVVAAWAAARATHTRRRWLALFLCGLVLGVATLVRPQSILLAPLLGFATTSSWRLRVASAGVVAVVAVLVCAPWTLRNCERMDRCAFVSVNGGWNLLIGTQPEGGGAWSEVRVPDTCTTVFDEAGKDVCFGQAARARIRSEPGAWLSLLPKKLDVTFDYGGAGPWYLHEANADAFSAGAKLVVGGAETLYNRALVLVALFGAWAAGSRHRRARLPLLVMGAVFVVQQHATVAYIALAALLWWRDDRAVIDVAACGAIVLLAVVHGVFFGAGRYQLVLWPLLCVVVARYGKNAHPRHVLRQLRAMLPTNPSETRRPPA